MRFLWRGEPTKKLTIAQSISQVFIPDLKNVSDDYVAYQTFDTIQALASSLVGTLATAGLLKGAGVGDKEANVLSAAMAWLIGDGIGHVTRILFAWQNSSSLDAYSKQFRLLADVANDMWLLLGILSGFAAFRGYFAFLLCVRAMLMAVVGVAGAATRAAVVVHQARAMNVSDVAAKDGSQETLVNLCSLVLGLCVVPFAIEHGISWHLWALLTIVHIWANHRAVTALQFSFFNPFRLDLAIEAFQLNNAVPSVRTINSAEPIWPLAIWRHRAQFPALSLGEQVDDIGQATFGKGYGVVSGGKVLLESGSTELDWLRAYYHGQTGSIKGFEAFTAACVASGWQLERVSLCSNEYRYEYEDVSPKKQTRSSSKSRSPRRRGRR